MARTTTSGSSGISLPTILFVVFLVLKLLGKITWSWWWVCAPLWISWAILGVVLLFVGFIALLAALFGK